MTIKEHIKHRFAAIYNTPPLAVYFSPGRVNLIGEHIDYHGGLVLPVALSIGTYGAYSLRNDDEVRLYSTGYCDDPITINLGDLSKDSFTGWANYVRGVFSVLKNEGYNIPHGLNIYLESDMPTSGGLSSSSSLELLIIKMLNDIFNFGINHTKMALLGKKVENEYIGVLTGIMDQFVIANGKKNNALLLNTDSLKFDYIPIDLKGYQLVIVNTNKRRGLADSKYNERFNETMGALKTLQAHFKINNLTELTSHDLPKIEKLLDPLLFRRVRHIITEQERTLESAKLLQAGNIEAFAKLLSASHHSLRDDYEVTGIELDTLVYLLLETGAIGARMTGAGFGGCAIALVPKEKVEAQAPLVIDLYKKVIGYAPSFFASDSSDGTHELA
ncbi:MAG: Galactokinase [Tenericutes bacterium ADurb.Bin087]|nr:MAG: Galactokinase [Tenericutes bacterium ADurb.Bin087]